MNIRPVNLTKTSFGKIDWGKSDEQKTTEKALTVIKEQNDIYNKQFVKFNDIIAQLQLLANEDDTFFVKAEADEDNGVFTLDIYEEDQKELIDKYSRSYMTNGRMSDTYDERFHRTKLDNFAKNILHFHQSKKIIKDVKNIMNALGNKNI